LPDYLQPLVTFMYVTGWRRNEVVGLEWRQVDLTAGTVTLDPGTTKNDEGRVFPVTVKLRTLLEQQHVAHEDLKKAGTIGSFRKTWIAACQAAGCPGRGPRRSSPWCRSGCR
jgi:integrase